MAAAGEAFGGDERMRLITVKRLRRPDGRPITVAELLEATNEKLDEPDRPETALAAVPDEDFALVAKTLNDRPVAFDTPIEPKWFTRGHAILRITCRDRPLWWWQYRFEEFVPARAG